MSLLHSDSSVPEVFSLREVALAAGVSVERVSELIASGAVRTLGETRTARRGRSPASVAFVPFDEAVRLARWLTTSRRDAYGFETPETEFPKAGWSVAATDRRPLFSPPSHAARPTGMPLAVSSTLHAAVIAGVVFLAALGPTPTSAINRAETTDRQPLRLVYLALPGPGGGGGGGGRRQVVPPPKAERRGAARMSSPRPARKEPPPIVAAPAPVEPPKPPINAEQLPPIAAPIVTAPADQRDRIGVPEQTPAAADSHGPGAGGGAGRGEGTGLGDGDGPGVGPGSGGGTGGGPYRPGSGIEPPRLLREIKPDYTEEARQRGVEGDVLLEIVVRRDGSVGDVRILQELGAGLDQRAAQAVRQWRFEPARRLGAPVDVVVEVAVEFKLR